MKRRFTLDRMRTIKTKELPRLKQALESSPDRGRGRHHLPPAEGGKIRILAEVKKASPSLGDIRMVEPSCQARLYQENGADAVSVLTDGSFFSGSWKDLKEAADAVSVPVLCKEFILYSEQIDMAERCGADLVLLIARMLSDVELAKLYLHALQRSLIPLVEVHRAAELPRVLALQPDMLMVNMRDLESLCLDFDTGIDTLRAIPEGVTKISASGINGPEDVERIRRETGASIFLVGSSLMGAPDPGSMIRELSNVH